MSGLTLYGCPKACSLVSHIALEMTGVSFEYRFINLFKGEQRKESYLKLSPRGKVPILQSAEHCMPENTAILMHLAIEFPDARLLPAQGSSPAIQALSDLSWFASGIHPVMTRMQMPARLTDREEHWQDLRTNAIRALSAEFAIVDQRLSSSEWWFKDRSVLDAYLFWIWARSGEGLIDLSPYLNYARHARTMLATAEVKRALDRERSYLPCFEQLDG